MRWGGRWCTAFWRLPRMMTDRDYAELLAWARTIDRPRPFWHWLVVPMAVLLGWLLGR